MLMEVGTPGTKLELDITFSGSGTPPPPPPPVTTGAFIEKNGIVVIEVEAVPLPSTGWVRKTQSGTTFYEATANSFNSPGSGVINYDIQINNPGIYRFVGRNKINFGSNATEHNDIWVKLPNNADVTFFGYDGSVSSEATLQNGLNTKTNVVFPKGTGLSPVPNGGGGSGYFKVYMKYFEWLDLQICNQ